MGGVLLLHRVSGRVIHPTSTHEWVGRTPGLDTSTAGMAQLRPEDQHRAQWMAIMAGAGSPERLAQLFQQYTETGAHLLPTDTIRSVLSTLLATHAIQRQTNPTTPLLDLRHLQLKGLDGSNLDFSHTDLSGTHLDEADLTGATFYNALLQQTRCIRATMPHTQLYGARFYEADLSHADLRDSQAQRATLDLTTLNDAKMDRINLNFASVTHCILTNATAPDSEWMGSTIWYTQLNHTDLRGANFTAARMKGNTLVDTQLQSATLTQTHLNGLLATPHVTCEQLLDTQGDVIIGVGVLGAGAPPTKKRRTDAHNRPADTQERTWIVSDDPQLSDDVLQGISLEGHGVCPTLYQRMGRIGHPSLPHVTLVITPDHGLAPPLPPLSDKIIQHTIPDQKIRCLMLSQQPLEQAPWPTIWSSLLWSQVLLRQYDSYDDSDKAIIQHQVVSELLSILSNPDENEADTQKLAAIVGNIPPTHALWQKVRCTIPTDQLCQIEDRILPWLPIQSPYLRHMVDYCCQVLKDRQPEALSILPTLASLTPAQLSLLGEYLSPPQVAHCQRLRHQSNTHLMMSAFKPIEPVDTPLSQLIIKVRDVVLREGSKADLIQSCQAFPLS